MFNIIETQNKYEFIENKKLYSYTGYAFIDENNRCMIIVYGKARRDQMTKYLLQKNNGTHKNM